MYYPYLRARQFELIALRELAKEQETQGVIIPILEPIKKSSNNLDIAYQVFQAYKQSAYIIANPIVGEDQGDDQNFLEYLRNLDNNTFRIAFHYRNNAKYIEQNIKIFDLDDCMLLCPNDVNENDIDFRTLAQLKGIKAITIEDPGKNRTLHRFIKNLNKTYIRLDDLFEKKARNSDFLDIEEHRFSEEHLYYQDEGFQGFSDYTVLPSEYVDGGSTPRAVAIHLTYFKNNAQIWIRHFTSYSNDSIANVQGKFAEAAEKAVRYCQDNNLTNSAILELESYFNNEHYPGLGTVKKISIKNHLLIVSHYLKNRK